MSDTSSVFICGKKKYSSEQLFAIHRLQKELYQLKKHPFNDVVAEPLETNIFLWHGNLRGPAQSPFEGGIFHFEMRFPEDYPKNPPTITFIEASVPSPFVLASWDDTKRICLSLTEQTPPQKYYTGWSPIYTVSSVLSQLQSLLLDGLDTGESQSTGHNIQFSQKQTSQWKEVFENRDQRGDGTLTPSEIRELMLEVGERKPSEEELALHYKMLHLPKDQPIEFSTFLTILQRKREYRQVVAAANRVRCSHQKCTHAPQNPFPAFPELGPEDFVLKQPFSEVLREELVCFYSKNGFLAPETATLGFGVSFQRNYRDGKIYKISSPLDVISLSSFRKLDVNKSVDNASTITHWLPLYINEEHGKRALHLASRSIGVILNGSHRDFKPENILEVIPKLLSNIVAEIITGKTQGTLKMIEGYCQLHRLFLALARRYPAIVEQVRESIQKFIENPEYRTKENIPNLGDFLCLLPILEGVNYKDLWAAMLQECTIRNVNWILQKFPELEKTFADPKIDQERIKKSFQASVGGYQILLFHKYFLDRIAHPTGVSLEQVEADYDSRFGYPSARQVDDLQKEFARLETLENFDEVYVLLGFEPLSREQQLETLRNAVSASAEKNYHGKRLIQVQSADEFLKEKARGFVDLEGLVDEAASKTLSETRASPSVVLKENESMWQEMCETRFGVRVLPTPDPILSEITQPWKHLYLKLNLEDLLRKFNENTDFKRFYRVLDISASVLKEIEFTLVPVTNIKSNFHYLTQVLTRLWSLEKFTINKGEIFLGLKGCKALCKGLKNNPNSIRMLDLHYSHFTSSCMEILEEGLLASKGLISLNLEGNPLGETGAVSIAKVIRTHQGITHLNMTKCGIDEAGAKQLAGAFYHNKSLRVIHLGKNHFGAGLNEIIKKLAYHPTLERLYLPRINLPNRGIDYAFTSLFEISLSLKYINLYETQLSSAFTQNTLHGLSQNRSLTELDLGSSSLGAAAITPLGWALARNRNLTSLELESAGIGEDAILKLSEAIYDSEKEIKDREAAKLVRKLTNEEIEEELRPRGCSLVRLNFSNNSSSITDPRGHAALERLVSLSTQLVTLNLSRCNLGVLAGDAIGAGLRNHPSLQTLDLSRNSLGEHGVKKLCKGLYENTSLTSLDLSRNRAGGRGISAVSHLIANSPNTRIQVLNVFGNLLGIEGARFIADALRNNKTVTDLDLGCNAMRPKGVSAISQALPSNSTLKILRLKQNFINDRAAVELSSALNSQSSVLQLCLAGNRIKDSILNIVVNTLGQRTPAVKVDIAELLLVTESSRLQRSIYCTPLPFSVTESALKKVFYDGGCGAIVSVSIKKHAKRSSWDKAAYAFIEFADPASVLLALDIGVAGNAKVGKVAFKVIQAQGKTQQRKAKKQREQ